MNKKSFSYTLLKADKEILPLQGECYRYICAITLYMLGTYGFNEHYGTLKERSDQWSQVCATDKSTGTNVVKRPLEKCKTLCVEATFSHSKQRQHLEFDLGFAVYLKWCVYKNNPKTKAETTTPEKKRKSKKKGKSKRASVKEETSEDVAVAMTVKQRPVRRVAQRVRSYRDDDEAEDSVKIDYIYESVKLLVSSNL